MRRRHPYKEQYEHELMERLRKEQVLEPKDKQLELEFLLLMQFAVQNGEVSD